MSEALRSYLLRCFRAVYSSFGAADLEINIAAENDFTIALRRLLAERPELGHALNLPSHSSLPMVFQYNPLDYVIETSEAGELVISICRVETTAPKLRYNLHDLGCVVRFREVERALAELGMRPADLAERRLDRTPPVVQVVDIRYQAGRFGSGFKPRPKSDAGIREIPLAPEVVAAIRRQLPPGNDSEDLVFTGPGGGVVAQGTRTVLSRHNFRRTYHSALAKLADPATQLRPTAARVLKMLRATGPKNGNELVSALAHQGRAIRPATVETALRELAASGLAAPDGTGPARRWSPLAPSGDPLLDMVDLRGAHDFRHTFATWLEDAGIPARVIDELMGHEASTRGAQHLSSTMGAHYRHTTPEMATRVVTAIQDRLVVVVSVAEQVVEAQPTRVPRQVF